MNNIDKSIFDNLCINCLGLTPSGYKLIPAAGGDRKYYRLQPESMRILGVIADNKADSKAYVSLSQVFQGYKDEWSAGFYIPKVLDSTDDFSHYLVEDVGDVSLYDRLNDGQLPVLMDRVVRALVSMQTVPEDKWERVVAYPPLSKRLIMWDLNYFKYEFLKICGIEFDENALEDDFERLANDLLTIPHNQWGFMMRDCQSRNIMLGGHDNQTPYFIDFQGGRKGPLLYDAVSLLWQAKAGFSKEFRMQMLDIYCAELAKRRNIDPGEILGPLPAIVLFRTLQVLGAYGFRGLVQKRAHFITSIPAALRNLADIISFGWLDKYPCLHELAEDLVNLPKFNGVENYPGKLVIKVFSFSYKKGYPDDLSGNGGGFMFDCRGMHNPGRYDEYKLLTGRDASVIEFLKEKGEADVFAEKAIQIVIPTVERYLKRGFTSLQIGFGCTGGRHRSVYCAEYVAGKLAEMFPHAKVELIHREQEIVEIFN
ncbi:MAG: phosphotransferase [Muribaculaceae bacterium]|nr:phosphotransferase [Muribaculaceae bacterium]